MITIVDYGMGNLRSVSRAFENQGFEVQVTSDMDKIYHASGLVLPGVGHFGACVRNLQKLRLTDAIDNHIKEGKPFLGICLGLQILFEQSDESPGYPGLGILSGKVSRFPRSRNLKVPHMGWNQIHFESESSILSGIPDGSWFYFVHSYYVEPAESDVNRITSEYGVTFTAAVERDNVFACQFHPEKSSELGLRILKNFASTCN